MTDTISRRTLVRTAALAAAAWGGVARAVDGATDAGASSPAQAPTPFALEELSIADLQQRMASGQDSSRSLLTQYLARIDALDRNGPALRHIIELNPDALEVADLLDEERKAGHVRGPLHGIPILLKDNIDTADRMHTSAGSLALKNHVAARDSAVAARLRAAGAVLIGKANMSEWANLRSSHPSSGWSARGGQGKNPYALDRSPSGSSSGCGGAVAANYCAAAVGSETDGAVTSPCATESLVGIKPTIGLVGRSGIIPISSSQDTAGPMARTVRDVATLLEVMAGYDPLDSASLKTAAFTATLKPEALRGVRLGVARKQYCGYSPAADKLLEEAIVVLRQAGAEVIDPANIATAGRFDEPELQVLLYEFKATLNAYLAGTAPESPVHSIEDLIRFNQAHGSEELALFGQEYLEQAIRKGPLTSKEYLKAHATCRRLARKEGIDATLQNHRLDALIAPTQGPVWLIDPVNGDSVSGAFTTPAAVAGYPHVTVPMGFVHGLPVGLSFVGAAWSDGRLLSFAYAFEQLTHARRKPELRPSAA